MIQDIDSREDKVRKRDRDINSLCMGEVKLVALFFRKRWFSLVFSRCGFQGKLKLLLGFGFIVSFNIVLFCTYTLKFCQCVSIIIIIVSSTRVKFLHGLYARQLTCTCTIK